MYQASEWIHRCPCSRVAFREESPLRVVSRYILFQIPGTLIAAVVLWVLHSWNLLSFGGAVLLLAIWIAKDCIQYPFVRRAYGAEPSRMVGLERLLDSSGVAQEAIDPSGWVLVQGELWRAEREGGSGQPISPGARVRICGVRNLTLLVRPVAD